VVAGAVALWLVYGAGYIDYDALYALVWAGDLAGGSTPPDLGATHSPTNHPLGTLLALATTPFGRGELALDLLRAVSLLSFAALGWAAYRLGEVAFGRVAGGALALRSPGMELALELVVRAAQVGMVIGEVPIVLHPRGGESKLVRFRDGWRGVRLVVAERAAARP
jgi:hypothetical protein